MPSTNTFLLLTYFLITSINLWAGHTQQSDLVFYTKLFLIPSLALWFYFQTKNNSSLFRKLILVALFFSWGGDTLLLFVQSKGEHFFLMGLLSFLITHILYSIAFFKTVSFNSGFLQKTKWVVIPFVIILILFLYFLFPSIASAMQIPIMIYSSVIMLMVLSALNWNKVIPQNIFLWVFLGAVTFMISDMIIAIDKFKSPVANSHLWVMGTYLLGQFGIVYGAVQLLKTKFQ